jgi:hypothetical protein
MGRSDSETAALGATSIESPHTPIARPFAGHQFAVPTENRVRRHDCRNSREQAPSEAVSQFAEPSPLVVLETHPPTSEPGLEDSILLAKKCDQIRPLR